MQTTIEEQASAPVEDPTTNNEILTAGKYRNRNFTLRSASEYLT